MMYECMREGHAIAYGKFVSAREEANRLNTKLSDATNELVACRGKVETFSQSILTLTMKFRKAKEKLREYRTKAQSFYRQLSFASWGQDTEFSMGYLSRRIQNSQRLGQETRKFSQDRHNFPQGCRAFEESDFECIIYRPKRNARLLRNKMYGV
jgi:chromosome segregation ATPase